MPDFLKRLTPERCTCDSPTCDRCGFREGLFFQGNGFPEALAEEIARRYNAVESREPDVVTVHHHPDDGTMEAVCRDGSIYQWSGTEWEYLPGSRIGGVNHG